MNSKGFTLVELIIAISLAAVLLFVAVDLLLAVFRNPQQNIMAMDNIDQARFITTDFVNELRGAAMGNDGSYSLNQAGDQQIIFYSGYGANGAAINRVRYYVSNNNLYKGVIVPTGSPLAYNLPSEKITTLMTGLANASTPIFYYYDGNYSGTGSSISQPVNVNNVKFVKINLVVPRATTAQSTSTFSVNAGVAVRNLKSNLGN